VSKSPTWGPWAPHPRAAERRRSAVQIAKLALSADGLLDEHRHQLLSVAVWKHTEADGKFTTRFRSEGALEVSDSSMLNHEHVYPRKWLRERMLAEPSRVEEIISRPVVAGRQPCQRVATHQREGAGHRHPSGGPHRWLAKNACACDLERRHYWPLRRQDINELRYVKDNLAAMADVIEMVYLDDSPTAASGAPRWKETRGGLISPPAA
jgi:hypothetical protein